MIMSYVLVLWFGAHTLAPASIVVSRFVTRETCENAKDYLKKIADIHGTRADGLCMWDSAGYK